MSDTVLITLFTLALLAVAMAVLLGGCLATYFTHRLMKGLPPIPSLPQRARVIRGEPDKDPAERRELPQVRT